MKKNKFPKGWDEKRIKKVLAYYEKQSESEVVSEYKSAPRNRSQTVIEVPNALVPIIRELIARHESLKIKRNTRGK